MALRRRWRGFGRKVVREATMSPSTMSLFHLLKFLALFVSEIDSYLPVRLRNRLMNMPGSLPPNLSELNGCLVDDRRNLSDLFRREVEFGTEPFLHARADLLRLMKPKKKMPGIQSSNERATDSSGNKYKDESRNQFPSQSLVHFENSS